jgi:hypothetical protein
VFNTIYIFKVKYCKYDMCLTQTVNNLCKIWLTTQGCIDNDRPDLSSERAPPNDRTVTFKKKKKKRSLVKSPRLGSTPRLTDWLTVSCNVTLTLTDRPPLWSSGQSSRLQNGEVLCFLWGTNWIYICYIEENRPPLWSSGQSSWLENGGVLFPVRYELNWYMLCRRK